MKKITFILFFIFMGYSTVQAEVVNCGSVTIDSLLSGPRHGSMMRVTPACPGTNGWICLDPDAEHMSAEVSKRLYSQLLSFHIANKPFFLHVSTHLNATTCGGYPVVEDVRTKE